MKFSRLFFCLAVFCLIVFSGCGKEDCSELDSTYEKYSWDDEVGECVLSKSVKRNVCGNGVAEEGETFCNCPDDVQKSHPKFGCMGEVGDYLEKVCDEKFECVLAQNELVIDKTKVVEFKNSDVNFEGRFTLKDPFILNTVDDNRIEADISLFKTTSASNIKDLVVQELKIENGAGLLLASEVYSESVGSVGDSLSLKRIGISEISKYESRESLKLKLIVSYTKEFLDTKGEVVKTEEKIETLVGSLGSWDIVNPKFYEGK